MFSGGRWGDFRFHQVEERRARNLADRGEGKRRKRISRPQLKKSREEPLRKKALREELE